MTLIYIKKGHSLTLQARIVVNGKTILRFRNRNRENYKQHPGNTNPEAPRLWMVQMTVRPSKLVDGRSITGTKNQCCFS